MDAETIDGGRMIEDPPNPDLADLQQRELPLPVVPVRHEGPVRTLAMPARSGPAFTVPLGTSPAHVVAEDPRRAAVLLVATVAWNYWAGRSKQAVPIPANVVLTIHHCGEIYASGATPGDLSVITEVYAD